MRKTFALLLLLLLVAIFLLSGCAHPTVNSSGIETVSVITEQEVKEVSVEGSSVPAPTLTEESQFCFDLERDYRAKLIAACVSGDAEAGEYSAACHINITFAELFLVCKVVMSEAGSDWLSDEHQRLVASVLLNRVDSPEFPDSISECVYQPGQYYGVKGRRFQNLLPDERTVENVLYVIENGSVAPPSVVFQSGNKQQGSGVWKSIEDEVLPTTYFCYSSYPELYGSEVSAD